MANGLASINRLKLRELRQSLISQAGLTLVLGLSLIAAGLVVLITGKIRNVIAIGDAKYLVAGVFIPFGLWVTSLAIKSVAAKYRVEVERGPSDGN